MRIIYPDLMKQYNTYIKNTNKNAMREFRMSIEDLMSIPPSDLNERQKEFLKYYHQRMPVGVNNCVMNKICRRFEEEFDRYIVKHNASYEFDYSILKSDASYSRSQYNTILKLYNNYNKRLHSYMIFSKYERVDECDALANMIEMRSDFIKECTLVC